MTKSEKFPVGCTLGSQMVADSGFGFRASFELRHSSFVIPTFPAVQTKQLKMMPSAPNQAPLRPGRLGPLAVVVVTLDQHPPAIQFASRFLSQRLDPGII